MKFLSYKISNVQPTQIGVLQNQSVYNLNALFGNISLIDVLQIENYLNKITSYIKKENPLIHNIKEISFLPVIPRPTSLKDAYAFREHVETCRKNRGAKMIAEFDKFPVFYFSNHNAMYAHGEDIELMPDHFNKLDYELEFIHPNPQEILDSTKELLSRIEKNFNSNNEAKKLQIAIRVFHQVADLNRYAESRGPIRI